MLFLLLEKLHFMRVVKSFLIVCMAFVGGGIDAQSILGITIDSFPTNGHIGDTATYYGSVFIHNYSGVAFSDTLALGYSVNGTTYNANNPAVGIYFKRDTAAVSPHDSVKKSFLIHFTPSIFQIVGTSGVVIWPIAPTAVISDSASCQVALDLAAGIAQTDAEKLLVYMEGSQLYLKTDAQNLLKRVRIYASNGQFIEEQSITSSSVIQMDKYATGLYIAQVTFADDSQKAFKIINMSSH